MKIRDIPRLVEEMSDGAQGMWAKGVAEVAGDGVCVIGYQKQLMLLSLNVKLRSSLQIYFIQAQCSIAYFF